MLVLDIGSQAEAIFLRGSETVISSSQTIVAGPPAQLVKRVDKESEGSSPVPLEWTVAGTLVKPIRSGKTSESILRLALTAPDIGDFALGLSELE